MLRAKIAIFEAPPAARQTENGFRPELRVAMSMNKSVPPGVSSRECVAEPRGLGNGVEHIGAQDEIKPSRLESLLDG